MTRVTRRACKTCHRPLPPRGTLVIDEQNLLVMSDGQKARALSNGEFLILQTLAQRTGHTFSHATLEEAASMDGLNPTGLSVAIAHLRAKVGRDRIVCIPRRGYQLTGEVLKGALA